MQAHPTQIALLEANIDFSGDCWIWTGYRNNYGYGMVRRRDDGRREPAHRAVYRLLVGEIATGLVLHHRCEVRACCRPDHLMPLTPREHSLVHADRAPFCAHGHEFTPENTLERRDGGRRCRICARAAQRRYRHGM